MGKHGENIRKRKDGRWEARIIAEYDLNGKAKYRSFYGKTYQEAKEKRNNYLKNTAREPVCKRTDTYGRRKITVSVLMQEWMEFKRDEVKESTFVHYQNLIEKHILPALGPVPLSALTSEMINNFLKKELHSGRTDGRGGLSPKTVSDLRSVLLLGLKYADRQQYLCAVRKDIFAPRAYKSPKIILTRQEQSKLEKFLCQHPDTVSLGILIALYSGLRIGELCALQWGDIYFESGIVRISKTVIRIQNADRDQQDEKKTRVMISYPKTECSKRLIPLPAFILNFLKEYRRETQIFLITNTIYYTEPRLYLRKYKQVLQKAGLPSYTFHTLRHTFATRCVESGFDTKSLSEILGHANVSTTMQNYVHPSLTLKKEQMDRLQTVSVWGQNEGQSDEKISCIRPFSEEKSYSVLL